MAIRKTDWLNALREQLIRRRQSLVSEILRTTSDAIRQSSARWAGDVVDQAHSSALIEQASTLAEVEREELAAIDEALQMMEDGQYGRCQSCGRRIPLARLKALPTATYCVRCRSVMDRSGSVDVSQARYGKLPATHEESDSHRSMRSRSDEIRSLLGDGFSLLSGN